MKLERNRGTIVLMLTIAVGFGIEIATNSIGNDAALLKLGALPDDGQLRGEFWRIATYSFFHFNWLHLLLNVGLLFWIGRIVEQQIGTARGALIYFVSVLCSAAVILLVHNWRCFRFIRRRVNNFISPEQRRSIPKVALDCARGGIRCLSASRHQHGWSRWRNHRRSAVGIAHESAKE